MSLMALKRGFEKNGPVWGGILAFLIIAGIGFTGFGAYNQMSQAGPAIPQGKVVAVVGDLNVTSQMLDENLKELLARQAMFGQAPNPSPAEKAKFRYLLLNSLRNQQAAVMAAKKAGVQVTDADINAKRNEIWKQARTSVVQTLGLKEDATDSQINEAMAKMQPGLNIESFKMNRMPADAIRQQMYQEGLTAALKKQIDVPEEEVKRSYSEIQVRHILIKSGAGGLPEAAAKDKADRIVKEVLANPAKMAEIAKKESQDPGSKDKGGFYDWAPASQYVAEFSKGAFDAGVGKVNPQPVKTQFGFHIIKLEGERPGKDFPKDWDKEKAKYIDQYKDRFVGDKVQAVIAAEEPNVKVDILDPILRAAKALEEVRVAKDDTEKNAKNELALTELAKVKKEDDIEGAAPLLKAEAYHTLKKVPETIAAYEEALTYGNSVSTRIALAQVYVDSKDKVNALKQIDEVEKLAVPDLQQQMQLYSMLSSLGEKDRAKKAMDRFMEMQKRQSERMAPPPGSIPAPEPTTAAKPDASKGAAKGDKKAAAGDKNAKGKESPAASPSPVASATPAASASPKP